MLWPSGIGRKLLFDFTEFSEAAAAKAKVTRKVEEASPTTVATISGWPCALRESQALSLEPRESTLANPVTTVEAALGSVR